MPQLGYIILLMVIGMLLLSIEAFIIPGFGFVGIGGVFFLVIAGYQAYTKLGFLEGTLVSLISVIVIALGIIFVPKTKAVKRMILTQKENKENGFVASSDKLKELVGKTGTAESLLRPAGIANIENERVDVITDGEFIDKDKKIKVVNVEGNKIFVEEV